MSVNGEQQDTTGGVGFNAEQAKADFVAGATGPATKAGGAEASAPSGDAKPQPEKPKTPYDEFKIKNDPRLVNAARVRMQEMLTENPKLNTDQEWVKTMYAGFYDPKATPKAMNEAYEALGWKPREDMAGNPIPDREEPAATGPKAQEQPASGTGATGPTAEDAAYEEARQRMYGGAANRRESVGGSGAASSETPKDKQDTGSKPGEQAQTSGSDETDDKYRQAAGQREHVGQNIGRVGHEQKRAEAAAKVEAEQVYTGNPEGADVYEMLGVPPGRPQEEYKRAFRAAGFRLHPDRNGNTPEATDRYGRVSGAYAEIVDETHRKRYDRRHKIDNPEQYARQHGWVNRPRPNAEQAGPQQPPRKEANPSGSTAGGQRQEQKPGGQAAGQPPRQEQRQQQPPPRAEQKPAGAAGAKPGGEAGKGSPKSEVPLATKFAKQELGKIFTGDANARNNAELRRAEQILNNPNAGPMDLNEAYRIIHEYGKPKDKTGTPPPSGGPAKPGAPGAKPNPFGPKPNNEGGPKPAGSGFGDRPKPGAENKGTNKPGGGFGDRPAAGSRPNPFEAKPAGGAAGTPGGEPPKGRPTPGEAPTGAPERSKPRGEIKTPQEAIDRFQNGENIRAMREGLKAMIKFKVKITGVNPNGTTYTLTPGEILRQIDLAEMNWGATLNAKNNERLLRQIPTTEAIQERIGRELEAVMRARDVIQSAYPSTYTLRGALKVFDSYERTFIPHTEAQEDNAIFAPMVLLGLLDSIINGDDNPDSLQRRLMRVPTLYDLDLKIWYIAVSRIQGMGGRVPANILDRYQKYVARRAGEE